MSRTDIHQINDLLRIAGAAAKLGGWHVDLVNRQVYWSAETRTIHEVAPDFQPTLDEALDFYAPEYQAQIRRAFDRCATEGAHFDEVLQLVTGKGRRLWARAIGEAVKQEDGKVVALHGAFQDISELIAAREQTESLSRQLQQTLENINDGFMLIDHNWCFGFINTQAEILLQRRRDDLLGKHIWDEFPAARDSDFRRNYELAAREQRTVRFTDYYPEPLNAWFDVSTYPTPDGLAVYFRDVTERVVNEESRRISEERFNLIAKATNDVIWDWDFANDTVWWNDNLLSVFGHDPGQLEGALLNLAINARDAMPAGGKLTIETGNTQLDQTYADSHDEVLPGQYVVISVSDTGTGMAPEVVKKAFEPFFTTKQIGKGSGLGLSMVFGFAKQSRGHVKIYSEVGEGSTIKLYMPRAMSADNSVYDGHLAPRVEGGKENILLVEDDPLVREHVSGQLKALGYCVHTASNADEAHDMLKLLSDIDLLFTDVVMPGTMNGRQLADLANQLRPGIRVLFTSGYTENAIVHHGRLDRGVHLLNKPYRRQELAAKVRKVLDETSVVN